MVLTRKLVLVKIFTSNHFRTHAQRERERERERERKREKDPSPQTELQSNDHNSALLRPSSTTADRAPVWRIRSHWSRRWQHRANQVKIDSNAARSCLRHTVSPSPYNLASRSNLVASLSSFFFQFDWIWWIFILGFVSFVFLYWGMILYICLPAEKMWARSRKCVFYDIFKNTTKHQKIFFKTFFEIQPSTWKYFCFLKIALLENIYFLENILHEPNTAWDVSLFLKNHKR